MAKMRGAFSIYIALLEALLLGSWLSGWAMTIHVSVPEVKEIALEGVLRAESGKRPVLRVDESEVVLVSDGEGIAGILADPRLSGKRLKLTGIYRSDGAFAVHDLFTVRKDGLYRIIYFCFT